MRFKVDTGISSCRLKRLTNHTIDTKTDRIWEILANLGSSLLYKQNYNATMFKSSLSWRAKTRQTGWCAVGFPEGTYPRDHEKVAPGPLLNGPSPGRGKMMESGGMMEVEEKVGLRVNGASKLFLFSFSGG